MDDMARGARAERIDQIAKEVLAILGTGQQVAPFSSRYPAFDMAEAYDIAAQVRDMRRARGENAIGRKIGFTNRAVWGGYPKARSPIHPLASEHLNSNT